MWNRALGFDCGRPLAAGLLLSVLALLSACGCPADDTRVLSDTREPLAAGTRVFSHEGPTSLVFDSGLARLKELDQGAKRRYCGQRMAAQAGVTDADIVADVSRQLGQGWGPAQPVTAPQSSIKIYRWQSECSARFYALVAHQGVQRTVGGEDFRPMVSLYGCG